MSELKRTVLYQAHLDAGATRWSIQRRDLVRHALRHCRGRAAAPPPTRPRRHRAGRRIADQRPRSGRVRQGSGVRLGAGEWRPRGEGAGMVWRHLRRRPGDRGRWRTTSAGRAASPSGIAPMFSISARNCPGSGCSRALAPGLPRRSTARRIQACGCGGNLCRAIRPGCRCGRCTVCGRALACMRTW